MASSVGLKRYGGFSERQKWLTDKANGAIRLQNTLHLVEQLRFKKKVRLKVVTLGFSYLY
jgi:hypothetical protein